MLSARTGLQGEGKESSIPGSRKTGSALHPACHSTPAASGDPEPPGTPTFLGLALGKLPQELPVLLLQAGQAAVQGSLPALGLPQPLLRVLGTGTAGSEPPPGGGDSRGDSRVSQGSAVPGDGDSQVTGFPGDGGQWGQCHHPERETAGPDRSELSQGTWASRVRSTPEDRDSEIRAMPGDGGQQGQLSPGRREQTHQSRARGWGTAGTATSEPCQGMQGSGIGGIPWEKGTPGSEPTPGRREQRGRSQPLGKGSSGVGAASTENGNSSIGASHKT